MKGQNGDISSIYLSILILLSLSLTHRKIAITHTQEEVLPKRKKKAKQHWMTQEILDLMETRKSKKVTTISSN